MTTEFTTTIIFTDGACSGNPGKGGWAAIVATPDGQVKELGGRELATTNNRMELMGALKALQSLEAPHARPIFVYTDSTYVIRGITQWVWGWMKRGWKNAEGEEVANQDLWQALSREIQRLQPTPVEWKYVRGHTGVPGNERCDEIAVQFSQGSWVDLFDGSLLQYNVAVFDLPPDQALPEMRPKTEKVKAYSYLSYVGGVVVRHPDWASCEARVKGQSGAKFKKAMNANDEQEILKSWGIK